MFQLGRAEALRARLGADLHSADHPCVRGCMEPSAHHKPMGSTRETQFRFHMYFAESGLTCLKLWKLQHNEFGWVSCRWLLLLKAVSAWDILCFSDPIWTLLQFHARDIASLCLASSNRPQSPQFAHVHWCWLHYHQPTSQSISCSLLTTLAGGNDVGQIERKQ